MYTNVVKYAVLLYLSIISMFVDLNSWNLGEIIFVINFHQISAFMTERKTLQIFF